MGVLDDAIRQHLELKRQHGAPEEELQRQEEEALGPARRDVAPAESAGENGDVELEDAADEAAEAAPAEAGQAEDAAAADAAPAAEAPATAPDQQETMLQELPSEPDRREAPDSAADHEPLAEEPGPALYDAAADTPAIEQEDEPSAGEAPAPESADAEDAHRADGFESPPRAEEELHPETVESPAVEDEAGAGGSLEEELDAEEEDLFAEDDEDAPEGEEHPDDVLEDTPDFLQETPEHDRLWFEQKPPRDFDFD